MVGELLVVWCDKKLYGRVTCWLYGAVKESYAGQAPALVRLTKYEKKLHPAVRNNPFYHIYVTSQTPYPPFNHNSYKSSISPSNSSFYSLESNFLGKNPYYQDELQDALQTKKQNHKHCTKCSSFQSKPCSLQHDPRKNLKKFVNFVNENTERYSK